MNSPRLKNGYARMSDADLIKRALYAYQQTSTNTATFATPTPTMPVLLEAIQEFQTAVQAAGSGDRMLIMQKNNLKKALVTTLHIFGGYVLMTAGDDEEIIRKAGLTPAKTAAAVELGQPEAPQVSVTKEPGKMIVEVPKVTGALSYQHQYSTDPELKPESWTTHACSTRSCVVEGLVTGKVYFFRVGAIGAREQLSYGDVTTRLAS